LRRESRGSGASEPPSALPLIVMNSNRGTEKPVLIYDGRCGFCARWVDYCRQLTFDRIDYAPSQEVADRYPEIAPDDFKRSVWLVLPNGDRFSGAEAVFRLMASAGATRYLWLYQHVPAVAPVAEASYRFVAAHRTLFYWVTQLLWGKQIHPVSYGSVRSLFLRGLAIIYLIAFLSLIPQIVGLAGADGISPAGSYLRAIQQSFGASSFAMFPTLAWLNSSDTFLVALCGGGAALALLLLVGIIPLPAVAGLWILYLSLVIVGQDFLAFQWDALLVETGFLAMLFAPLGVRPAYATAPPAAAVWAARALLFRLMFESGLVKLLSGDRTWRNLTALTFHYETQPLPTPLAWYAQQLPVVVQKISVAGVFAVELAVPLLFFMPRRPRIIGAWITLAFQLLIAATGNYAFFNLLAMLLCIPLFDDHHLRRWLPLRFNREITTCAVPRIARTSAAILGLVCIAIGLLQVSTMLAVPRVLPGPIAWINERVEILHVINRYGLFAVMTTTRPEIIIEGSDDGENWKAYEFRFKPGAVEQPPHWVAPYQPRLDWQMWFAALSNPQSTPWFSGLMLRILQGSTEVLGLLKTNPFPNTPPKFLRASVYDYHFSDRQKRREIGVWWTREYLGVYFPAVSLREN
jgi:predicted DCC family thiol-disulfide oxidoreductase YuxK